jgi:hypothetical protein
LPTQPAMTIQPARSSQRGQAHAPA